MKLMAQVLVKGVVVAVLTGGACSARGQDFESPPPSAPKPLAPPKFVMPDIKDEWMDWSHYDGSHVSTRLSLVPIVDYNAFWQDGDSISQVGAQKNQWDLRTFRIMLRGTFKFRLPVDYFVSLELKGKDHVRGPDDSKVGWTDAYLAVTVPKLGKVFFGKLKEPFVYEMVGDAANLQQEERVLSPFFASRDIGIRVQNTFADKRMSWSAGWFNDWWVADETYKVSSNVFAGRWTALPSWSGDGAHYVHVGASARYVGADKGTLRFRGRPESNVSSYYVDTSDLPSDHTNEVALEGLWGNGPFFLTSEWVRAGVDASDAGNPAFWGTYVTASYVLTGEHRPYDQSVAYARRVMPKGRWGAWEVFTRFTHVDVDDRSVVGGLYNKGTLGLTWWATRHWRLGVDYGLTDLDRFGKHGITQAVHPRLQWVY